MRDELTDPTGSPSRRRAQTAMIAAVCAALTIAACGGGDGGSTATSGGASATASADASGCEGEGTKVAIALHFRGPFTEELARGARQAAADCGADLQVVGPDKADPPAATQAFRDVIAAGAQGVAYVASPPEIWRPVVEEAIADGIEVAALNVPTTELGDDNPIYVGADEKEIGLQLGKTIADKLGPDAEGQVVVGICIAGLGVLEDRVEGVKQAFAENAPGIEVLGPFDVKQEAGQNFSAWSALVTKYPDAKAFIGVCPFDTPSLDRIKDSTGGDWLFGSTDFDGDNLRSVQEGGSTVQVGQNPYIQGYVPIRLLIESIAMGKEIPHEPGGAWISSGVDVVTADNVEEAISRGKSDEESRLFYQDQVDEIFADPSAHTQSLEGFGG